MGFPRRPSCFSASSALAGGGTELGWRGPAGGPDGRPRDMTAGGQAEARARTPLPRGCLPGWPSYCRPSSAGPAPSSSCWSTRRTTTTGEAGASGLGGEVRGERLAGRRSPRRAGAGRTGRQKPRRSAKLPALVHFGALGSAGGWERRAGSLAANSRSQFGRLVHARARIPESGPLHCSGNQTAS